VGLRQEVPSISARKPVTHLLGSVPKAFVTVTQVSGSVPEAFATVTHVSGSVPEVSVTPKLAKSDLLKALVMVSKAYKNNDL